MDTALLVQYAVGCRHSNISHTGPPSMPAMSPTACGPHRHLVHLDILFGAKQLRHAVLCPSDRPGTCSLQASARVSAAQSVNQPDGRQERAEGFLCQPSGTDT